jgi:GDP-mannose 6-dehydrogenase
VVLPMFQGIADSNQAHIDHVASLIKEHGARKVLMIGLSFKHGTDDLRESPFVSLAEHLIGKGYQLTVYDPYVSLARIVGANRRYIETVIPHIASCLVDELAEACRRSDVIVAGFSTPDVAAALTHRSADCLIVDLVGLDASASAGGRYVGVCW